MRVFVTGTSGYIGSAVVPELIGTGHQVVGLVRSDAARRLCRPSSATDQTAALLCIGSMRRACSGWPWKQAGSRLHGAGEEGVPFRDIAEAIGRHLNLPVVSISGEEADDHFGFLSAFVSADNPTSTTLTASYLGGSRPTQGSSTISTTAPTSTTHPHDHPGQNGVPVAHLGQAPIEVLS